MAAVCDADGPGADGKEGGARVEGSPEGAPGPRGLQLGSRPGADRVALPEPREGPRGQPGTLNP